MNLPFISNVCPSAVFSFSSYVACFCFSLFFMSKRKKKKVWISNVFGSSLLVMSLTKTWHQASLGKLWLALIKMRHWLRRQWTKAGLKDKTTCWCHHLDNFSKFSHTIQWMFPVEDNTTCTLLPQYQHKAHSESLTRLLVNEHWDGSATTAMEIGVDFKFWVRQSKKFFEKF